MKRSTAKLLLILLNILTIVGGIAIVAITKTNKVAILLFLVVMLVISWIPSSFLRCRHCGHGQGKEWLFVEYCPYCGEKLED